jgi:hypothetical protein
MNEKEQKIAQAITEMVHGKDPNASVEVNVTVGDGTCKVKVKTPADITIGDIIPLAGRYAGLRIRPDVEITK